jgi:phosphate transport system substrate-binding protein
MIKYRSFLLLSLLAFLLFSCNRKKEGTETKQRLKVIRVKGSETVRPVIEKVIEQFSKINPEVFIEYEGGGSNLGLLAIKQQETDLAFASRPLTEQDLKDIDTNATFVCRNFAYDGLTIIVNLANPVKRLTISQLGEIYSGRITNWKDVGGKDLPIVVYSRDVSSGTYLFFKEHILGSSDYTKDDINLVHNKEIISNVIQTPNAIGYVGHGDIDPNLKVVSIAAGNSGNFIEPGYNTIKSKEYPLSRNLYYLYPKNSQPHVIQLDSFLRSPSVKQIITEIGFIPE